MGVARIRPAAETSADVPAGLEGVVVAETTVGDVRGQEGFFHYRQYSAVDLAERRSLEDVWHLLFRGRASRRGRLGRLRRRGAGPRARCRPGWPRSSRHCAAQGAPLDVLRSAVSVLGAELGWRPTHDIDAGGAVRPGARAVRRRPDDSGGGPPAP